jgi:hypothetical protein
MKVVFNPEILSTESRGIGASQQAAPYPFLQGSRGLSTQALLCERMERVNMERVLCHVLSPRLRERECLAQARESESRCSSKDHSFTACETNSSLRRWAGAETPRSSLPKVSSKLQLVAVQQTWLSSIQTAFTLGFFSLRHRSKTSSPYAIAQFSTNTDRCLQDVCKRTIHRPR